VSPEVIALWARILAGVPRSRLILKAHALDSQEARRELRELLSLGGIAMDRVDLRGAIASPQGHLKHYGVVDIALDTYPYHGTTTTCEALWMGVPVISLAGSTHVSRVGASILRRVGLPELVASSADDYVRKAIALAGDLPRLRELRSGLRDRMRASGLLDARGFARGMEAAYRQMWARWCRQNG
jgi:predicted O-linked N-acetylglucosamine transferase (SPINDLY family)